MNKHALTLLGAIFLRPCWSFTFWALLFNLFPFPIKPTIVHIPVIIVSIIIIYGPQVVLRQFSWWGCQLDGARLQSFQLVIYSHLCTKTETSIPQ